MNHRQPKKKRPTKICCGRGLNTRPRILKDLIKKTKGQRIDKLYVCRNPISSVFTKLLNLLTFGDFYKKLKEKNYDDLYHLFLTVVLENGEIFTIEKNQRVNVIKGKVKGDCLSERIIDKNLTISDLILNSEKKISNNQLYIYKATSTNCQQYLIDILNSSGITEFNTFIKQNVKDLIPVTLSKISNQLIKLPALLDYIVRGGE